MPRQRIIYTRTGFDSRPPLSPDGHLSFNSDSKVAALYRSLTLSGGVF